VKLRNIPSLLMGRIWKGKLKRTPLITSFISHLGFTGCFPNGEKGDDNERLAADFSQEVDLGFTNKAFQGSPDVLIKDDIQFQCSIDQDVTMDVRGIPCSPFVASDHDVHDMCMLVNQQISEVDR